MIANIEAKLRSIVSVTHLLVQAVNVTALSDQDLWNQIDARMTSIAAPQDLYDLVTELERQLSAFQSQQVQPTPVPQSAAAVMGTLARSKVKLEAPEKFDCTAQKLSNFLFQVKMYVEVLDISDITEYMKLTIILLIGRALTWWCSVSQEIWEALGYCDCTTFAAKLAEQFRDLHHVLRMRPDLAKLK